jgi:ATP-binding cassette subfamily B protein
MATLARLVREAQAQAVTDHTHDLLHAKSIAVDLAYYENSRYYDALHRAQQEASLASEA